jgi:hypothetical protein
VRQQPLQRAARAAKEHLLLRTRRRAAAAAEAARQRRGHGLRSWAVVPQLHAAVLAGERCQRGAVQHQLQQLLVVELGAEGLRLRGCARCVRVCVCVCVRALAPNTRVAAASWPYTQR